MYHAVTLTPEDRDFHWFLWKDTDTDPVMDYGMTRVTFGIASAAFLATILLLCLAKENESEFSLAAKAGKGHHTFLHQDDSNDPATQDTLEKTKQDALMVSIPNRSNTKESENTAGGSGITSVSYVTAPKAITSNSVLMVTAEVILSGPNGHQMVARALLDSTSTAPFVTERLVQHLKLLKQKQEITINGIGEAQCSTQNNAVVNINLTSTHSSSILANVQAVLP